MYEHQPVLLKETIEYLNCKKEGVYVDGTLGRGGHTQAILDNIGKDGLIVAIDRDLQAINKVKNKLNSDRIKYFHDNFVRIPEILGELEIKKVEGMIFDLGLSSPQVDKPERGFSYNKPGPLDMRMNRKQKLDAARIVNQYSKSELTKIIKDYGEENWASRIADFIVQAREKEEIKTTEQLVEIIKNAIPASARRSGGHPARRTFQALRIATNNELEQLEKMIKRVIPRLKSGGRIVIISFHSLEDRIVKHSFKDLANDCVCPPDFPECVCDKEQELEILTKKPVRASKDEIQKNPRARSAKLRAGEKI
ncbi:MAG: 16S rRNA (cytosine(1402)-N(4))-methyltransferase RsmH [Halanaerobiaceae bacterium]